METVDSENKRLSTDLMKNPILSFFERTFLYFRIHFLNTHVLWRGRSFLFIILIIFYFYCIEIKFEISIFSIREKIGIFYSKVNWNFFIQSKLEFLFLLLK